MKTGNVFWIGWLWMAVAGCGTESDMPTPERPQRADTEEDLLKDSVYFYTHAFYLWQEALPDWFSDIRGHTQRFNSADAVLESLKTYARDDGGQVLDRFSFLDRWGTVNAEVQQGLAGSFGFDVRYGDDSGLYVKKVDPGSPANHAGMKRGWQLLRINGRSDLSLASLEADNFDFLFRSLDGSSIDLVARKPDGGEERLRLDRRSYRLDPVLASGIFTEAGKKIGYFAFDSFVSVANDFGGSTYVKTQLDQLMARFEEAGVSEMIVDLRYNGGGAIVTAEYLSNRLAPPSADGALMFTSTVNPGLNDFLSARGVRIDFSPVYFRRIGTLNLNRIYFLVTEGTASASELLINNLTPYVPVTLIGEHRTYGKPVGFFNWNILGVDLYAVSFQTFNAARYGDYFSGMDVDKVVYDDLTRDFGDPREALIAEALQYARTGSFTANRDALQARTAAGRTAPRAQQTHRFPDRNRPPGMYRF